MANKKTEEFLGKAILELVEGGISVNFKHSKTIPQSKSRGFATESAIYVATRWPVEEWFSVFLHEYCHFLQTKDEDAGKKLKYDPVYSEDSDLFDNWMFKIIDLPNEQVRSLRIRIQRMEADCEERTVKLIKKYRLPVDSAEYARSANAYLIFHNFVEKHRTWCNPRKKPPGLIPEILEIMPDKVKTNNFRMSKKFEKLVFKHCI